MQVQFHRDFDKQFAKLSLKKRAKVMAAVALYLKNPDAASLRPHALSGEWRGCWSISAGGDLRLHFELVDDNTVAYFVAVGTHSQLYK
ncbi:type II toxin-antitoxin system mRNA interferase toxin, RelE/StbE family [Candidatus Saccharibacteria bacterium]|nr:MAG: type II toxin-antitoxin system mRNA interferase toxin, RelE/StbE family [Candidatus Saccharibacteria bacterium]